jgi:acetolactate synthase-1/2/3 large subunit
MSTTLNGVRAAHQIARVLAREGVTHVFGVPGGYTVRVFDGLYDLQDQVRTVLARHEQSASCMADMAGRMTGHPAVLMGQGAFIGSSGAFGVMEAFLASSPMVVITDLTDYGLSQHAPMQAVTGDYGTVNLPQIFSAMTKFTTVATTPNEAVHGVELALQHAMAGRPGPAAVLLRRAAIEGDISDPGHPAVRDIPRLASLGRPQARAADVREVARLLADAERPVFVAGNGIRIAGAYEELADVATVAGAAVVTSLKGKGSIPESHPWSAGPIGGYGSPVANNVLAAADLVVVLGSRTNPNDTLMETPWLIDPSRQILVQVDVEHRHLGWTFPVRLGIVADVGDFLRQLRATLQVASDAVSRRASWLTELRQTHSDEDVPALSDARTPLLPQRVVSVLNDTLTADHRLVLDAGNNRIFTYHFFKVRQAGSFFAPGGMAGMGWGPCAATAAAIIDPSRRAVSVVGDGGMFMSVHVLSTAVEHEAPVTFVVLNNQGLANVRDVQKDRRIAVDLPPTDFAAIARAFGAEGHRIERDSELADALKAASEHAGPVLLDVAIDQRESYRAILQRDPTRGRPASA